jgi:hypothetical protein
MTALCPLCDTVWSSRQPLTECPSCGHHELQPRFDLDTVLHARTAEPPNGRHCDTLCGAYVRLDQIAPSYETVTCSECIAERTYAENLEL